MRQVIRNGLVVTGQDTFTGDVLIEDERIVALGRDLVVGSAVEIDASDRIVMPGGVDPHVHMEMPMLDTETCDTFTTGTAAAAHGGTTTVVDFALQARGSGVLQTLETWRAKLERHEPVIDVGLHMIVTDLGGDNLRQLRRLPSEGVTSMKLFMAYKEQLMLDDESLFDAMELCGKEGLLPMVHAENGGVADALVRRAIEAGNTAPRYHALTRPPHIEAMAVRTAISIAELAESPLYLVHLSTSHAVDSVAEARASGQHVYGETCPQYLFLDESIYDSDDEEVGKYVFTPPARSRDHQDRLWDGLDGKVLSVVSTDHCPFCFATQKKGRRDFSVIPNGAPGIEWRLLLAYDGGVRTGRISLGRMVELLSAEPAKIFGLYPRKGSLAPGSDADVVILDPEGTTVLSARDQVSAVDYCTYEGREVRGRIARVISRGETVVLDGSVRGRAGHGAFVPRTTSVHP
jgi:dihydropyrimidinase